MAKALPCRHCGHGRTQHTRQNNGEVTRCKYRYHARDGGNVHGDSYKPDADGRYPKSYQCMCPKWEPEMLWRYDEETDTMRTLGYPAGYEADGSKSHVTLEYVP